jgi:paired amphipathic helix protein Sin3a
MQVYAQVTVLFNNDKDLLDEFKQFLPDTSSGAPPAAGGLFGMLGQVTAGMGAPGVAAQAGAGSHQGPHGHGAQAPPGAARLDAGPPEGAKKAPGGGRSKKRAAGAASSTPGAEAAAPAPAAKSKSKKSKHSHAKLERSPARDVGGPVAAQEAYAPPMPMPPPSAQQALMYGSDGSLIPVPGTAPGVGLAMAPDGSLVPMGVGVNGVSGGMGLGPQAPPLATTDEVAFFDRVKKHIDDRATYLEFLKLLNLYTQDVIDVRTLVDRASLFIGGNRELFNAFQRLCGYDMGKHGWLEAEDPIIENVPALQRERVDLGSCKVYGASYRKLPKAEINLACSGRDPMCWEVLNDTWVSHPTWASEGESFNPHKKNVYEDALYRSEEERHEYDYHIEANLRTIALLEPIAARITTMDADERAAFRLKPGLGGQSKSIYQRVVKKVYGREHGVEVIAALHDNPCVAVPVVLARLKQKDEEWKRAQREWNKVWREVDARNYYKSLDHQGVNFKASDKKVITTKAFVSEIEAKRTQQLQARLAVDPNLPRPRPQYQLAYALDDTGVLMDVLKLALSFLDRAPYSRADCDRIEGFLRTFVPLLLALDPQEFEEQLSGGVVLEGQADEEAESRAGDDDVRSDADASDADSASVASTSRRGGAAAARRQEGDLRRRLLRNQAEAAQGEAAPEAAATTAARASSPALAAEVKAATEAMDAATAPVVAGGSGAPDVEMLDGEAKAAAAQALSEADGSAAPATKEAPADEEMQEAPVEADSAVNPAEPKTWLNAAGVKAFDSATRQNVATPPAAESAAPSPGGSAQPAAASIKCNFFCSTSHYVFVRLLQVSSTWRGLARS